MANNENGKDSGKSIVEVGEEFDEFCKTMKEHLSVEEMRRILEVNGQDASGSDDAVVTRWY